MQRAEELKQKFIGRYGRRPKVFRAPGRVNLIGEHTDYNDGFVMPAAIGFRTLVGVAQRTDRKLRVYSENFEASREFDLDDRNPVPTAHWSDYVHGVAVILMAAGYDLPGADLLIQSGVPLGAGLSSSAAIEVATAMALLECSGSLVERVRLAKLCQQAENEFVGMRCGIMDQFVCCHARSGHALMLDCRSLSYTHLPIEAAARLVISNTMVKHELAVSEYNRRRAQCEEAVLLLRRRLPTVQALRDINVEQLERYQSELPPLVRKRARHVVSENARVQDAARSLENRDLVQFGKLMYESHASLRDDFEVSCGELDTMVSIASELAGVYGSRMTGGGFGGCTVTLVAAEHVEQFKREMMEHYRASIGLKPEVYVCEAAEGAGPVPLAT